MGGGRAGELAGLHAAAQQECVVRRGAAATAVAATRRLC